MVAKGAVHDVGSVGKGIGHLAVGAAHDARSVAAGLGHDVSKGVTGVGHAARWTTKQLIAHHNNAEKLDRNFVKKDWRYLADAAVIGLAIVLAATVWAYPWRRQY